MGQTINGVDFELVAIASGAAEGGGPFAPIPGASVSLTVGASATTAPVAMVVNGATSYRVRNASTSQFPATWILVANNATGGTVPAIPAPYSAAGTGGTAGDMTIDPGGIEIMGLTAAQQAAGTLYLSAICPAGGSAVLSITMGTGV